MPQMPAEPEYQPGNIIRKVSSKGAYISFEGRQFFGERVAIRPRGSAGHHGIFFGAHQIAAIDLTQRHPVTHVAEQVSAMSSG